VIKLRPRGADGPGGVGRWSGLAGATLMALALATTPVAATPAKVAGAGSAGNPAVELAYRAGDLRLFGAKDLPTLIRHLRAADLIGARALILRGYHGVGRQLSDFLAGSTQHIVVRGNVGLVGWYNPIADAWILTEWRKGKAGWILWRTDALTGDDLAGDAPYQAAPAWTGKPASVPVFLPERAKAQAARLQALAITPAMGALINDAKREARAWSTLELREADAAATLTRAARIKGYERWAPDLHAVMLGGGHASAPLAEFRDALHREPAEVRKALRPVAAFPEAGGLGVIVQSPLAPQVLLVADLSAAGAAPARAVALRFVPLMKEPG
jgi:hypothetical protein